MILRYKFNQDDLVLFEGACMYNVILSVKGKTAIVYEKSTNKTQVKRLYSLKPYVKKYFNKKTKRYELID